MTLEQIQKEQFESFDSLVGIKAHYMDLGPNTPMPPPIQLPQSKLFKLQHIFSESIRIAYEAGQKNIKSQLDPIGGWYTVGYRAGLEHARELVPNGCTAKNPGQFEVGYNYAIDKVNDELNKQL